MKTPRYKTAEWLYKRGCAHDPVEQPAAEPSAVDIWVDPTPMLSLLFRIAPGQPAFILWAEFATRKAEVYIAEFSFELRDAPDVRFQLLPCPGPKRKPYCFPDGEYKIEQELVVNAHFPGALYRNHPLAGYIMGVGFQPLPSELLLYRMVTAELSVVDEFGEVVGSTQFYIPLDPKEHGKQSIARKGKGVFEPLDGDEQEIRPEVLFERTPPAVPSMGSSTEGTKAMRRPGNNAPTNPYRRSGSGEQ